MKLTSNRLLQLVLVLIVLLFFASKASALPRGWYQVACVEGGKAVIYSLDSYFSVQTDYPCTSTWLSRPIFVAGIAFSNPPDNPVDPPNPPDQEEGGEFVYLPHNADVVRIHVNPPLRSIPFGDINPNWQQIIGPTNASILLNNAARLVSNIEAARFPVVYSATIGNVSMAYKKDLRGGHQILLSVADGNTIRRILLPAIDAQVSQTDINNLLLDFLAHPEGFMWKRLVRECEGNIAAQENAARTILPVFINSLPLQRSSYSVSDISINE